MPRRRKPNEAPPSCPLSAEDRRDLAIAETLVGLLDGFERASLLNGLPAGDVARWLRKRTTFYIAARLEGLVD